MDKIYFENKSYYFLCPHQDCKAMIEVPKNLINCKIFRHAVYKENMKFVNPHAKKEECQEWLEKDLIYGCSKPFYFDGKILKICDYL